MKNTFRDALMLLAALILGGVVGLIMARLPSAYTFIWWLGAACASLMTCPRASRRAARIAAAFVVNAAIFGSFVAAHGFEALMKNIFHASHLSGGAQRTMISDFLSSFLVAQLLSLGIAVLSEHPQNHERVSMPN